MTDMIPVCVCGHSRNHHSIEPPYECYDLTVNCDEYCPCDSFIYPIKEETNVKR